MPSMQNDAVTAPIFIESNILIPFIFDKHDDHISSNKFIPDIPSNLKIEICCYQVYSTMSCNAYIDITDIAEEKYRAISMYQSQMNNFDYVNWNRGLNAFNSRYSHNKEKKYIYNSRSTTKVAIMLISAGGLLIPNWGI